MEEYLAPLIMFGASLAGSAVQGTIIKHKTKMANDTIPTQLNATWGTIGVGAGAITDDPLTMVAGFAGATVASVGHRLVKLIFQKNG